ncbi:MAG TPA: hypothetical protein VKC90_00005, partial [Chitinophagaceae bacterium]|nr:hypothetical protein [Chitinophagaceae bacterium]
VFFSIDSTECMLIVLQKNNSGLMFGTARMIRGFKQKAHWTFDVSLEYGFENSYYKLFPENNFQNLATLARYSVLTDGEMSSLNGCEIDDNYWFKELKK